MSEDRLDPLNQPTECGKNNIGEYHIYPDICKCKYDKKEQKRKLINEIATEHLEDMDAYAPLEYHMLAKKIKELSK